MAPTMPSGHLVGDLFAAGVRTIRRDLVLARRYSLFWFAIACFDTLSLLPLEKTFVWPAKLTLAKILFLVNRWAVLLLLAFMQVLDRVFVPANHCNRMYWIGSATGVFTMTICFSILAIRVYALWDRSRRILGILIVTGICFVVLAVFSISKLQPANVPPYIAKILDLEGCGTLGHARLRFPQFMTIWATTFAVDAIILSLTIFRSVQIDHRAGTVPIVRALWRDGLVYYFLITLTHVVTVGMAIQTGKPLLKALNTPASLVLTSLMASRLVLSLHVRAATASVTSGRPVCRRSRKLSVPDAETTNDSNLRMEQIKSAQQL